MTDYTAFPALNPRLRHKAIRKELVQLLNERQVLQLENKLAEWYDSIPECCRRGLSALQIVELTRTYIALDELDKPSQ